MVVYVGRIAPIHGFWPIGKVTPLLPSGFRRVVGRALRLPSRAFQFIRLTRTSASDVLALQQLT
jgi:hypothetical protein